MTNDNSFIPLSRGGIQSFIGHDGIGPGDVELDGFQPLRKARSEAVNELTARFSFNSKEAKESYAHVWEKRDPWRMLKRNVSFMAATEESEQEHPEIISGRKEECVVVVDPFSSGSILAQRAVMEGYHCIRVFSEYDSPVAKLVQSGLVLEFDATFQFDDRNPDPEVAYAELLKQLADLPWPIIAVLAGAETGVELSDVLSSRLKVRNNGEELSPARRNKYLMGENVRSHGVRAAAQKMCYNDDDVAAFLKNFNPTPFKAVVKPLESAGSDDVFLCNSAEEVTLAFEHINGKVNGLGCINEGALVQEYLDGDEYVVDSVSRDGVHKIITIWKYDKRSVNGANFVYFGMEVLAVDTEVEKELVAYARTVLDAMGILNGPGHMEVKYTSTGPCLVEVGSRCHGGEGTWKPIVQECLGYNQIDATFDCYVMPQRWLDLPTEPTKLLKYGREVFLVARESGMLRALPGLPEVLKLPSYRRKEIMIKETEFVHRTIDCFTRPGSVQLVHEDYAVVQSDFDRIRALEVRGLFDFEIICPSPLPIAAVVIVDPFSSGALLAARVLKHKLRLVMVFSEVNSPIAGLVQQGTNLKPDVTIQHDNTHPEPEVAIQQTLAALLELPHPVIAILPGAETGVELADLLAHRLGMRNNGEELSEARRNKYMMGENVRSHGVRAAAQKMCYNDDDVATFLKDYNPTPFKAVVKPLESAGSDDVFLCKSAQEVKKAFKAINGKVNGLGCVNEGALAMEFLDGDEYVVDSVSRDGIHKIITIWKYDKRSVNDANFVYFGMELRSAAGKVEQELVAYARSVLDAMGIVNGPGHMEVKYTSTGPCLVEMGSRCHGGEGTWKPIAQECLGFNQIDLTLDAYIKPELWDAAPMEPTTLLKNGREVFLVSYQEGKVNSLPSVDIVRTMPSFRTLEMCVQPGSAIHKTIDCFTRPGAIQLVHENASILQEDYEKIRSLELLTDGTGLFNVAIDEHYAPQPPPDTVHAPPVII